MRAPRARDGCESFEVSPLAPIGEEVMGAILPRYALFFIVSKLQTTLLNKFLFYTILVKFFKIVFWNIGSLAHIASDDEDGC